MTSTTSVLSKRNNKLCIGIITIPHMKRVKYGNTHIMKSYIDWFESRDVSVVVIPYDTTEHSVYYHKTNGLLIPGGETRYIMKNKTFIQTIRQFIELSLQGGEQEYYPIWGTCFGFELLMSIIGGFNSFKRYNAHGRYPIRVTYHGIKSRMMKRFPLSYINFLEYQKSTLQNHEYGISQIDFLKNRHLATFYNILATSIDEDGKEYVAAIEGKYYPIYGVQWHPERQPQESMHFIDFFISEMHRNKHVCKSNNPVRLDMLIESYPCIQYPEHKTKHCYYF
jgi:gamma-glutamyl hydrolase